MIFIQALRKNDINPNGGKQVEFGKAFFETFNWEANTVHEIKIHVGSDVITTSLKVRGSQRGGDREGVDCKEYANDQGKFPLKDYFIEKMNLTPEHVGKVYLIFVPLKNPGTGKSFRIKRDTANQSKIRTTFHPDSDYSTFVGCYKPTMSNEGDRADQEKGGGTKQIEYAFVAQAFLKAYVKAWKSYCSKECENAKPQYLIIEEINRGNCAQIFGDLFQLLDRNEDGYSTYPIVADTDIQKYLSKEFEELDVPDSLNMIYDDYDGNVAEDIKNGTVLALPNNFYIWATMNTSDQSLFPIDSAFKRRWDWKYMPIDTKKENWNIEVDGNKYSWTVFLEKVNEQIFEVTKSEDKKLGFYFCRANNNVVGAEKFVSKVIFYLYNDVFKDYGYDRKMFKDENGKAIQFHEYFQSNGDINEQKAALFLDNLDVKPIGENKEE